MCQWFIKDALGQPALNECAMVPFNMKFDHQIEGIMDIVMYHDIPWYTNCQPLIWG